MPTLKECRTALRELSHLSDEELLALRDTCLELAELAYRHYLRQQSSSNSSPEVDCSASDDAVG